MVTVEVADKEYIGTPARILTIFRSTVYGTRYVLCTIELCDGRMLFATAPDNGVDFDTPVELI